jgi:hypothetical protein
MEDNGHVDTYCSINRYVNMPRREDGIEKSVLV